MGRSNKGKSKSSAKLAHRARQPAPRHSEAPNTDRPLQAIISAEQHYMEQAVGPIPPPMMLAEYERQLPGAAERFMRMAEKEQDHRHDMDRAVVTSDIKHRDDFLHRTFRLQTVGLWLGCGVILVGVAGGIALIYLDKQGWGLAPIIASLAGLIGALVWGKRSSPTPPPQEPQTQPQLPPLASSSTPKGTTLPD